MTILEVNKFDSEITKYCNLAVEYANNITYQSDYDILFNESISDPVTEHNNVSKQKSENFISKAFAALKAFFKNIKDSWDSFWMKRKMSPDEREQFEEFKKRCKNDPEFANKKIKVTDYQAAMEEYDKQIAELEKELQKENSGENTSKIVEKFNNTIKAGSTIVATNTVLKWARSNKDVAITIKRAIDNNEAIIYSLEQQLGKKEAKKFRKDINALSRTISLRKQMLKLIYKKQSALEASESSIAELVQGLIGIPLRNRKMASQIKNSDELKGIKKYTGSVGKGIVKGKMQQVYYKMTHRKSAPDSTAGAIDYFVGKNGDGEGRATGLLNKFKEKIHK